MRLRTINIGLSPNNTWKDTLEAAWLLMPWNWPRWQTGRAVGELENEFKKLLKVDFALAVGSGREALYLILKSLNLTPGDEIIVQGFTCMVVINSIIWNGLKPVYVDIDETYNYSAEEVQKKITPKTRAVIVQHTFGIPAKIENIKKLCEKRDLILIEDCAHALGAEVDGEKVGTIGDIGFYSMGRSKVISCISGGMIVSKNKKYIPALEHLAKNLSKVSTRQIRQNLFHPIICSWAKVFYFSIFGKLMMVFGQKTGLLNLEVNPSEKKGLKPKVFGTKLPNAMAVIALIQMRLLREFNQERRKAATYYYQHLKVGGKLNPADFPGAIFLRYPVLVNNPEEILKAGKKLGIYLGDWYSTPIAPADIDTKKTGYNEGECQNSESVNQQIINLPTIYSLNQKDLESVVALVNQYATN